MASAGHRLLLSCVLTGKPEYKSRFAKCVVHNVGLLLLLFIFFIEVKLIF